MAKAKGTKGAGIPHKHLHARASYLHQASSYLSLASRSTTGNEKVPDHPGRDSVQSRHLLTQLRAVSLKSQIRLAPEMKHTVCKRCSSLLIAGKTSIERIENESRGGLKPWADVLIIKCDFCGTTKRFPVGARRLMKLSGAEERGNEGKTRNLESRDASASVAS
jgi:ribonuclease P protein subunit RPR2